MVQTTDITKADGKVCIEINGETTIYGTHIKILPDMYNKKCIFAVFVNDFCTFSSQKSVFVSGVRIFDNGVHTLESYMNGVEGACIIKCMEQRKYINVKNAWAKNLR